jgi:hypothetical protein
VIAEIRSRIFLSSTLCAWAFLAASCVRPLGPGFHFAGRQTEIHASSAAPDTLHLRVVDRLENAGNRTLQTLDVRLPEGPNFGTQNFRVTIEGKEVSPQPDSTADRRMMRMPFDPPWEQNQPRDVAAEWDLTAPPSARATVAASPNAFYIADETALPLWQVPAGIFARGDPDPDGEVLSIFAPPDFRVLAPGKLSRSEADGNMQVRRFRIRPDRDFLPYVVAGRYQEQLIRTRQADVSFWTLRALDAEMAKTAGARLSSSMQAFVDFFGPASLGKTVVRLVEAPGDLPSESGSMSDPGGTSFPEGALLDSRAIAQSVASETVLQLAEYELARTWFGWRVRPAPEAQILMGRGLGLFGLVIAAEARETGSQGAASAAS